MVAKGELDVRRLLGDYSVALAAQSVALLLSFVVSFLMPKYLTVIQFGYWQLFLFYASYVGLFLLGLNDGIYLIKAGQSRDAIDKASIRSQFRFGLFTQSLFAAAVALYAYLAVPAGSRRFIILCTAAYLVLSNLSGFIGYVFQAMNETKLFSLSSMLGKLGVLLPLVVLLANRVATFEPYVLAYLVAQTVALVYCIARGWDFLAGPRLPPKTAVRESLGSIRVGIKLMLANVAGLLILGVSRFFIDQRWGISAFGRVSFSITLVSFFLLFVSQLAMVLFPALRAADSSHWGPLFSDMRDAMSLGLPIVYLLYFPIRVLAGIWLPQYQESLAYFAMLLPICVFDGRMNLVGTTYFKVFRKESLLLAINVVAMFVSATLVLVSVYIFDSVALAVGAAVVVIVGRSLISEEWVFRYLRDHGCDPRADASSRMFQDLALSAVFSASVALLPTWSAAGVFVVSYTAFLVANREGVRSVVSAARRVRRRWSQPPVCDAE